MSKPIRFMEIQTCKSKRAFMSAAGAMRSVEARTSSYKKTYRKNKWQRIKPYKCKVCSFYHLTSIDEERPGFFKDRK